MQQVKPNDNQNPRQGCRRDHEKSRDHLHGNVRGRGSAGLVLRALGAMICPPGRGLLGLKGEGYRFLAILLGALPSRFQDAWVAAYLKSNI